LNGKAVRASRPRERSKAKLTKSLQPWRGRYNQRACDERSMIAIDYSNSEALLTAQQNATPDSPAP
jgi:hypothetical protein